MGDNKFQLEVSQIYELAKKIWDYHHMNMRLEKADAIFVLCSHDTIVAECAAQLFLDGWAPLLIFSGGYGVITKNLWNEPEADKFAEIAIKMGVPKGKIIVENKSSNTGENVSLTKKILENLHLSPQKFILVQKPYMERRTFATFKKVWPEKDFIVTSPQVSFDDYLTNYSNKALDRDHVISIMVGDLQRIKIYPDKGFQIYQEIPADIWDAYEKLVEAGYTKHLVKI